MVRSSLVVLVAVFVAMASGGCSSPAETGGGDECDKDSDCKGTRVCEDGECVEGAKGSQTSTAGETSGESSSSGPGSGCTGTETACVGSSSMNVCDSGTFVTVTCGDYCEYWGFAAGGCSDGMCGCGDPIDSKCVTAMSAMCTCGEWAGAPCSDGQMTDLYIACHQNDPAVAPDLLCMGSWVSGGSIDCSSAIESCL